MKKLIGFLFLLFLPVVSVFAEETEVRVIDDRGLTRAVKRMEQLPATVTISFREMAGKGASVLLRDLGGVHGTLTSTIGEQGIATFQQVPAGAWQIGKLPKGVKIKRVKVQP